MLEYLLLAVITVGTLFYIVRSGRKKQIVTTSNDKRLFGKWTPVDFKAPSPSAYPNWSIETTNPLPYRPFKYGPDYFVTMGICRLDWNDWIEIDNQWIRYHNVKLARLTGERASRLCKTAPEAYDAALETMELLSEYLVCRYPSLFEFESSSTQKQIRIKATGEIYPIQSDDPLKCAAFLIQDDLAMMIEGDDGQYYLKAGAIPLPGFWRLEDKFNMSLTEIHTSGNVPKFREKLQQSMERFFQKMMPEHPVVRYNYSIQTDGELAWSSSVGSEDTFGIGRKDARQNPPIENIHFRSERQVLRRLPRSGAILFTIRTYFLPIIDIAQEPGVPGRLASALRSWPDEVVRHKGRKVYEDVLLKYLDEKHAEQCANGLTSVNLNSYPF
jgi:alpha-1,2-mannosyltransferase